MENIWEWVSSSFESYKLNNSQGLYCDERKTRVRRDLEFNTAGKLDNAFNFGDMHSESFPKEKVHSLEYDPRSLQLSCRSIVRTICSLL